MQENVPDVLTVRKTIELSTEIEIVIKHDFAPDAEVCRRRYINKQVVSQWQPHHDVFEDTILDHGRI